MYYNVSLFTAKPRLILEVERLFQKRQPKRSGAPPTRKWMGFHAVDRLMKNHFLITVVLCSLPALSLVGDDAPVTEAPVKVQLADPFSKMSPAELSDTGIQKLSMAEQKSLASWWNHLKVSSSHHHSITKEVAISSISDEGKHIVLDDGSKLSLDSSARKKVGRWAVGDTLGLGEPGKRGSVSVYHMASGQKIKAKREQAPQQKPSDKK